MNRSTPAGPAASVLIVSGLKREAAILADRGRLAICGDASTLRAKLAELTRQPITLVISWGVCGGLDPRLRPGDLILGAEVVSAEGRINTDEAVTSSLAQRLMDAGAHVAVERVAGVSSPVSTARAKAELRLATGAAAVDMESLIAGRFALERRTPFAILRAVADPADRDLPPLVLSAVDSDGRINAAAVLGDLVRSPGQFTGLVAAARDSRAAFRALCRCRGLLPGLFLGLGPANL
ncbi:MAG: phosphorylase [Roseiarcus sp.]|uniref:phosphorylase family protein n=1 Tax=Roseiarcus sp. TaxID=1969460 RepID=UPI003C4BF6FB